MVGFIGLLENCQLGMEAALLENFSLMTKRIPPLKQQRVKQSLQKWPFFDRCKITFSLINQLWLKFDCTWEFQSSLPLHSLGNAQVIEIGPGAFPALFILQLHISCLLSRWAQSLPLTVPTPQIACWMTQGIRKVSEGNNSKENAKGIPNMAAFKSPPWGHLHGVHLFPQFPSQGCPSLLLSHRQCQPQVHLSYLESRPTSPKGLQITWYFPFPSRMTGNIYLWWKKGHRNKVFSEGSRIKQNSKV